MTPDYSPIIGTTPVDGFLVDVGLGHVRLQGRAGGRGGDGRVHRHRADARSSSPPSPSTGSATAASSGRRARRPLATDAERPPMMLLPCPCCGPRNVSEFRYVGEERPRPDPNDDHAAEWRAYLYDADEPGRLDDRDLVPRAGCRALLRRRAAHRHQRSSGPLAGRCDRRRERRDDGEPRSPDPAPPEPRPVTGLAARPGRGHRPRARRCDVPLERAARTRPTPATRSSRRWPRRGARSSPAASSTTARAGC